MKMNLYIELHSKYCACGGTGWLKKIFTASQECPPNNNMVIIKFKDWVELDRPSTREALIQKVETIISNKCVEFINTLCVAIEKALTAPPCPVPLSGEEQDKGR